MPSIVFVNGSTGDSQELDLLKTSKEEAEKAFIETFKSSRKTSKKTNNKK
tara:strand:- start:421 stop:570 length:150 start_codon:yes stop_codon:yes gene_type:complete